MKKAIIILIILLCIAIIVLIVFNVVQNSNGRQEYLTINGADQYEFSNQMEKVTSYHSYTAVNNCINTYLRKIYYANHTELTENESDPQTPEEIREDIYNMLYKPYIQENDVNTDHHERNHENTLLGILFHQIHPQNKQQVKRQREKTLQWGQ